MKTYKQLGFTDAVFKNYNVTLSDSSDKVAYSIAKKYIEKEDGTYDTVLAVVVRGGGYGAEWASNFNVGSEGNHAGFASAAESVIAGLNSYVCGLNNSNGLKGELKIWMMGYSRAAATANLAAHSINKSGTVGGHEIKNENFYVYTFATPMGARNVENSGVDDSNIFNIISPLDFVPKVALDAWGFGRYGNTLYLSSTADVSETFTQIEGVYDLYSVTAYQSIVVDEILDFVSTVFPTTKHYTDTLQSIVMYLFEVKNSGRNDITAPEIISNVLSRLAYIENSEESAYVLSCVYTLIGIIFSAVDGIVGLNLESFTSSIIEIFGSEVGRNVASILGSILKGLATEGFSFSGLAVSHYSTYYLALLKTYNCSTIAEFNDNAKYKILEGACPVDLYVYNSDGKLVSNIVNNEVFVDILPTFVSGDTKYVFLDNNEYEVVWRGIDGGTMDYTIYEYDEFASLARTVRFFNLDIEKGTTYNQKISSLILDESTDYALTCNDETIESDYDSMLPNGEAHTITVNNGRSTVVEAYAGEEVTLVATLRENYAFAKWLSDIDVTFSSEESPYATFIMPDRDVTLTATFENDYISSMAFEEPLYTIEEGGTTDLKLIFDNETVKYLDLKWDTSDENTVSVSSDGMIVGNIVGSAVVTVKETYTGLTSECTVIVVEKSECNHSYENWTIITEATCTETGIMQRICRLCNESEFFEIEVSEHTQGETVIGKVPTCTQTGLTDGAKCSICGDILIAQTVIEAIGHKDADGDFMCDNGCGYKFENPADSCSHLCHKSGFIGFLWKIVRFFWKLFKMNPICSCGVAHY